jgi:hypothetical protein
MASTPKSPLNCDRLFDWKHAEMFLSRHETSAASCNNVCAVSSLKKITGRVDSALVEQMEMENTYWKNVLRCVF